jgi:hypothetical protein
MKTDRARADVLVRDTLRREMQLIREAILLVESGGSSRVTVAGLRFGEALLGPARRLAAERGVGITPAWYADEAGVDVSVERLGETPVLDER